ncbi:YHYH domain-containing protein [Lysobacter sp. TAF61]|uniref:YHYH domain-containing protein n=1 Tax=Lysobacter sp. TAF61 TaxID=3233072 RepID=UPI003F979989
MRPLVFALLALATASGWQTALAHGGGLDKNGRHTDRKNGDYHCHRGPAAQAPSDGGQLCLMSAASRMTAVEPT